MGAPTDIRSTHSSPASSSRSLIDKENVLPSLPRPPSARRLPILSAHCWIVVDAVTGALLHGYRHTERRCIASMTKIATAGVVLHLADKAPGLLASRAPVSCEVCACEWVWVCM